MWWCTSVPGGDPPGARSDFDFYVDSRGVTGFPKIIKLVNNISINPSKKNIDLTEMWSRYTRRGVTFQDQSWVHLDPWVAGRNQGKAVDFDGSVGKT